MRKRSISSATLLVLAATMLALPASAESRRYDVVGSDPSLRREVSVRHDLGYGFSAVLTPGEAARLRAKGARVALSVERRVACHRSSHNCSSGSSTRVIPSDRVPYGVERAYDIGATQTHPNPAAGTGVKVAVLDTGAKTDHLDLRNRIGLCRDATRSGISSGCRDGHGHGTHVAGTVAADGGSDGKGIRGVAPGATLWIYKVCGNGGSCWSDDVARAIDDAADRGTNIISMSIGGDSPSSLEHEAIKRAVAKGVLVVAAAGNDGPAGGSIDYPGAFAEVVAVAAMDSSSVISSWSSRGIDDGDPDVVSEREVEFAEAGVSVLSTYKDGRYATMSGTSMATPHLSGVAAARWAACGASRSCLRGILTDITQASGGGAGTGFDVASGYGLARIQ